MMNKKTISFFIALSISASLFSQTKFSTLCEDIECKEEKSYPFDLDGDGTSDIYFSPSSFDIIINYDGTSNLDFIQTVTKNGVVLLDKGDSISEYSKFSNVSSFNNINKDEVGKSNKFIGVRFKKASTPYKYGWIEVSYPTATTLIVHSYGYNTKDNEKILCGDLSNIENLLVKKINVLSADGNYAVNSKGGKLQMITELTPTNPNDCTVSWSISKISGDASIDQNGLLTASKEGLVNVVATANDGSGISGQRQIDISPLAGTSKLSQSSNKIFYNKDSKNVIVSSESKINTIKITTISGQILQTYTVNANETQIELGKFKLGTYLLVINTDLGEATKKLMVF